ncbi:MAG: TonB-dependent receptor plug domain-containing protein, partial [Marinomonas sp.]
MKKSILLHSSALVTLTLSASVFAPAIAHAQEAEEADASERTIVVTGSRIRGTPEDAATPVDVYSSVDLSNSGVSSPLEFIKDLPEVGSVLGDSNQFSTDAQGNQGLGSINLRGLGPTRTLVLFNGRRTLTAPGAVGGGFGDTNSIPLFALDRIEILKDGAAAVYGSDAIAGVANFVTKTNFEGVEVQGDYEFVNGSDGNHTASLLVGHNFGDDVNIMAGVGWQHRSELPTTERDYGFQPYAVNPSSWSALATPGFFIVPGVGARPDVGCAETGGTPDGICRFSFIPFDNLVEDTDQYQGYLQADITLDDTFSFHGEFTYAQTDLDSIGTSPAYPPLQGPGGARLGGGFTIDPNNPGAQVFANQLGIANPIAGPIGIFLWRPFGNLGNPTDPSGRGSGRQTANNKAYRASGTFQKEFSDTLSAELSLTWANYQRQRSSPGFVGSRLQDALNGLGGENCNPATGTPGVGGCQWFNPFINAGPGNPTLGLTNPFYVPGNENSLDLINFLQVTNGVEEKEETFIADLSFSGETGIDLGGGPIAWAAGAQYR